MNTVKIRELDRKEAIFHFTDFENIPHIVHSGGLVGKIGENSLGIEEYEKVFFSKGYEGMLELVDVWLKWEMTRLFGFRKLISNTKYDFVNWDTFYDDWYSGMYKEKEEYLKILYEKIYKDFKKRLYFTLYLEKGKDYNPDGIDDVKVRMSKKEILKKQLYLIYGDYSNIENPTMEKWNMFTNPGGFIPINKINLVSSTEGRYDALSIMIEVYDICDKRFIYFDLLDGFIDFVRLKSENEEKKLTLNV